MNVVEVENLSKRFRLGARNLDLRDMGQLFRRRLPSELDPRNFWALQEINFAVAQGEAFGIVGHNGSGKSTLLKLITHIYRPTKGRIRTHGRVSALIEVGAGFHPDLTGRENVYLNGSILGMKKREIDRRFDEIVEFAEMERFIDTPVKRYSSGMYMRLGFAVAAHVDPEVVLIDEVLAVGDESFQQKCLRRLHEMRREGRTIVFISHNMDAVAAMCHRVILISHGKALEIGPPRDVINAFRLNMAAEQAQRQHPGSAIPRDAGKEMQILEARLLDSNGDLCDTLAMGAPVQLECLYRANRRVENPAFGVALYRDDGVQIAGFNTRYDAVAVGPVEGEGRFTVSFPALNLLQGTYQFSVTLCHADDTYNAIDSVPAVARLMITSDTLNQGLVDIARTWSIESEDSAPFPLRKLSIV